MKGIGREPIFFVSNIKGRNLNKVEKGNGRDEDGIGSQYKYSSPSLGPEKITNTNDQYGTSAITSTQNNIGVLNDQSVESASGKSAMSHREFETHRNMIERDNQANYDQDDQFENDSNKTD
jgi:hypothetical protein